MTKRITLRSTVDAWFYGLLGMICAVSTLGATFAILADGEFGSSFGQLLLALVFLIAVSVGLLRLAALRVVVHGDHLQLINPLRSHRIAWEDVENIELVSDHGWHVLVWVGDVRIRAWGLSKVGRFGAAANSAYDNSNADAPRWLREGYALLRRYWRKRR